METSASLSTLKHLEEICFIMSFRDLFLFFFFLPLYRFFFSFNIAWNSETGFLAAANRPGHIMALLIDFSRDETLYLSWTVTFPCMSGLVVIYSTNMPQNHDLVSRLMRCISSLETCSMKKMPCQHPHFYLLHLQGTCTSEPTLFFVFALMKYERLWHICCCSLGLVVPFVPLDLTRCRLHKDGLRAVFGGPVTI